MAVTWATTTNPVAGGFQTQAELDAYRRQLAQNDATQQNVWNGALQQYQTWNDMANWSQQPGAPTVANVMGGANPLPSPAPSTYQQPQVMPGVDTPPGGWITSPGNSGNYPSGTIGHQALMPRAGGGTWSDGTKSSYYLNGQHYNADGTPFNGASYPPTGYQPPATDSATAQNPFLNLGLSAFQNTQKGFDTSWLDKVSNSLYDQANYNYKTNLKPTLDSNAMMAGGYGGDRAKLAEGVVMDRLGQNVINAMAPQYAAGYENSMNRALQGGTAAAGVGQGLESLGLQQNLGMAGIGLNQYQADTARQLGLGNLGVSQKLADIQGWRAQADIANPQYTNPWTAALGGGLGIAQLLNILNKG